MSAYQACRCYFSDYHIIISAIIVYSLHMVINLVMHQFLPASSSPMAASKFYLLQARNQCLLSNLPVQVKQSRPNLHLSQMNCQAKAFEQLLHSSEFTCYSFT